MKYILFCVTSDLSDNLTEMRIVKNSIVSRFVLFANEPSVFCKWNLLIENVRNEDFLNFQLSFLEEELSKDSRI